MSTTLGASFLANLKTHDIQFCTSTDGVNWKNNIPVGQTSQTSPALAAFNFEFWLAFIADDSSNQILIVSSTDGAHWPPGNIPTGLFSGIPPALVVFNQQLWMVFVANVNMSDGKSKGADVLICGSPDGTQWGLTTKVEQLSKTTPAMAVFNGKLWMAFVEAVDINAISVCFSVDGRKWSTNTRIGQSTKAAPAMVVFNNKLWMAFISNDKTNEILVCSSSDGLNWSSNISTKQSSKCAPSLTVLDDSLWLGFIANDDANQILVCKSPDGHFWTSNTQMGQGGTLQFSNFAPALTAAVVNTGTMRPRYQLLDVIYAPPGTKGGKSQSFVDYGIGSGTGTTNSISNSFQAGVDIAASVADGIGSVSTDFSLTATNTNGSSVQVTQTESNDIKVFGPDTDGIDHGQDIFVLWLNPLLNLNIDAWGSLQWAINVDRSTFPSMQIVYVKVAELKNPSLNPGVTKALTAAGLTESDYAEILQTNPFASGGTGIDPDRFLVCNQAFPYESPDTATDPVTVTSHSQVTSTTKTTFSTLQTQYKVSIEVSESLAEIVKLKTTATLEFTNTSTTSFSNSTSKSATVAIASPSFGYLGPIDVVVYLDAVYNTFMFALPTEPPSASGTLTDSAGAVVGKLVTLTVGSLKLMTYTDKRGAFRFYNAPAGHGNISVDGQEFAVGVGPGSPKAALRLAPEIKRAPVLSGAALK